MVLISSAAGHGNVISSSAPLKPPAEKSQQRLFVSALRGDWGKGSGVFWWGAVPAATAWSAFVSSDELVNQKSRM